MDYKLLGKTGIKVSELCLGTMTFGTDWNFGSDKEESKRIFDAFCNAGGNFFDTANIYTTGTSEKYLGEFMQSERDNLVIASKYSLTESNKINLSGNSRKNMTQSIEGSLRRLGTDYIDLYYVHAWDFLVAPEELMRNLEYLLASGKILSIGISDTPAYITSRCNTLAELRGWNQFAAYQVEYCLTERTADREVIPLCEHDDMLFCGFGPLAAGLLSGKYLEENSNPKRMKKGVSARLSERNLAMSAEIKALSKEIGHTPSQIAIRWAMQMVKKSSPIFGARSLKQCEENLKALDFSLSNDQMNKLNSISKIGPNNPNDFLNLPRLEEILYAGQKEKIKK
ncbi:aldo/keto reductase [Flavobacteriales bacterium]|nr:aldo/keto reductase [Flavobacteriales bacterium]